MNCQFCEDYEWSKKHRPKTGRELYTKYYVCLYERTLRKGCGLASTYTHKRRPLNFCPECGRRGWQAPDDRCRGRKAGRCL
nr:MAG TPA: MqsA [Caudoviricetes sp.]